MTTEKVCGCGHLWEDHRDTGSCSANTTSGRCGCVGWSPLGVYVDVLRGYSVGPQPTQPKSQSWFAGLIARVTRKFGATKHELEQWQDAIDQIRKNK